MMKVYPEEYEVRHLSLLHTIGMTDSRSLHSCYTMVIPT